MNVFLDTSVVIKLYFQEADSAAYRALVRQTPGVPYLATLSQVEFASASSKKLRVDSTMQAIAENARLLFARDEPAYRWVPITEAILNQARLLVERRPGLRTLDAIQLATAVSVRNDVGLYLVADQRLATIFRAEGLPTQ